MKWTTTRLKACKGKAKIACLTAGDFGVARLLDDAGLHVILIGDSLANTMLGYETTLPVTMEQMLHHTAAVARGVKQALIVADMPFMSYQVSDEQALANAGRFLKEAGADAVKLEGGRLREACVRRLVENGIPVMGHIGLTPQSVRAFGGYKVQGRSSAEAEGLMADAKALEAAGVFALVLECIPGDLACQISNSVSMPTIGIGAGEGCDGQVLVTTDMLGMNASRTPSFVKRYAAIGDAMITAFKAYREDVVEGRFPEACHRYPRSDEETA